MNKEAKGYIETNAFCTEIENAIQNNVQPTKCHSCWIDKTEIELTHKNTVASGSKKLVGDGMLWLPEFRLLIDSPMINDHIVDIHGFGKESSENIPAAWHSVISVASAEKLGVANAKSKTMPLSGTIEGGFHRYEPFTIKVDDYLHPGEQRIVCIDLITVDGAISKPIKGSSECSVDEFQKSTAFTQDNRLTGTDVTLIFGNWGDTSKNTASLLLCRQYDLFRNRVPKSGNVQSLYSDCMNLTRNNGIERKRTGGSSRKYQGPIQEFLAAGEVST